MILYLFLKVFSGLFSYSSKVLKIFRRLLFGWNCILCQQYILNYVRYDRYIEQDIGKNERIYLS